MPGYPVAESHFFASLVQGFLWKPFHERLPGGQGFSPWAQRRAAVQKSPANPGPLTSGMRRMAARSIYEAGSS
jgi:hypothetical protein